MVTVYHSERVQINISKRKGTLGQKKGQEKQRTRFQLSPHNGVPQHALNSPSHNVWQYILSVTNKGSTIETWFSGFLLGVTHRHAVLAWLTPSSQPPNQQSKNRWHHHKPQCVNCLSNLAPCDPSLKHTENTYQGEEHVGSEITSQG